MHYNGVAGLSERLATVLGGVKSAVLDEAAAMTQGSLEHMNKSTHQLLSKGIFAHAVGMLDGNDRLSKMIDELHSAQKSTEDATKITARALSDGMKIRDEMEDALKGVLESQEEYSRQAAALHRTATEALKGSKVAPANNNEKADIFAVEEGPRR